jgi:hypothetical protein
LGLEARPLNAPPDALLDMRASLPLPDPITPICEPGPAFPPVCALEGSKEIRVNTYQPASPRMKRRF